LCISAELLQLETLQGGSTLSGQANALALHRHFPSTSLHLSVTVAISSCA